MMASVASMSRPVLVVTEMLIDPSSLDGISSISSWVNMTKVPASRMTAAAMTVSLWFSAVVSSRL